MAKKRSLPARLREKVMKNGKVYYYYDTCQKPRKWLPLGADFYEALKQYADLEREFNVQEMATRVSDVLTFAYVAKRYVREVLPTKSLATQKCNFRELDNLLLFFDKLTAPINAIRPVHIREYLDWRSKAAKTRANREVALFSHIFNKAREWGYTDNENPVRGVKKNVEKGRDVYVSDDMFWRVFNRADRHIQQLMLVAYLCSQRVGDTLKLRVSDFRDGALWIQQNKTGKRWRWWVCLLMWWSRFYPSVAMQNMIFCFAKMSGRFRITSCAMAWTRRGDWLGWIRRIFNFGTYAPRLVRTRMRNWD